MAELDLWGNADRILFFQILAVLLANMLKLNNKFEKSSQKCILDPVYLLKSGHNKKNMGVEEKNGWRPFSSIFD
jgi:hypothetical protein